MTRSWIPRPGVRQTVTGSVVFGDIIQITGVGGDVTVSLDRPPYRITPADDSPVPVSVARARAQPSRLLLARHQIVPFTGRDHTLDELAAWVSSDEPVAAMLVHGTGGQGKTRLAGQVSGHCATAGWAVWQVTHTPTPVAGSTAVSTVELAGGAVLAVVDYADRWPASALLALLTQLRDLHARAGTRVRVLMLARSDGYWWPALADRADSDLGVEVDQRALPALAADSDDDRAGLFVAAAARFATALGFDHPTGWPVPDLTGDGFGQVLAVHMAALATVDATRHGETPPTRAATVSAYLLRREMAYWYHLHTRTELPMPSPPTVMHRTVVAATLTGVQPRDEARQALADAGALTPDIGADQIIDDHATCYPPADTRTVFEPLHPDRLGEDLIALSTPGHGHQGVVDLERDWTPVAITGLLTTGDSTPTWTPTAITVLVEAARRWPHLASDVLYPIIRTRPQLAIAAGGAALTRLTGIPGIDPTILEALEPLLPADRHIDLDIAAAAITGVLTEHRLAHTTDPAEQARLHAGQVFRLARAGRREQALAAAEKALAIRRRLAEENPDTHRPDLAVSLNDLGLRLSESGRREQAIAPVQEAAVVFRRLAAADPDTYLPHLGASMNNLGALLARLGRHEQALAPAEEAVTIRRQLAGTNPDVHRPDLAASLNNLGGCLAELGRPKQALAPAEEAVTIWRRLAETNPDTYLPDLARSLTTVSNCLSGLGQHEQALAPVRAAAVTYRRLAEANPEVYLPDLAASLYNLGAYLSELGRPDQALAPAEEAVTIRRRLAETNPDVHLTGLADSLNNLGAYLSELGRPDQALAPAEEAVTIGRRLAETNPGAHLPGLADSLTNLGAHLSQVGRPEWALAPAEEAVTVGRRLADADPDTYLPLFAASSVNLGACLSQLGRHEQALACTEGAAVIYRRLVTTNPHVHLPALAQSLINLITCLVALGRPEQALAASEEATIVRRRLAEADPDTGQPGLALSLWMYATLCVEVERNLPAALDAIAEATRLYGSLVARQPQEFAVQALSAHRTLADVLDKLGRRAEANSLRQQLDAVSIKNRS
ncbi:tetratricopeptide repeat protein [Actinoplanes sp. HUAS TT8]|uniref:tetratricopeptide repeat protein n=1 Tax=Actinoplanes sp. HUAS TT8 TaxID=3447453 RepID=UPI003F5253C9